MTKIYWLTKLQTSKCLKRSFSIQDFKKTKEAIYRFKEVPENHFSIRSLLREQRECHTTTVSKPINLSLPQIKLYKAWFAQNTRTLPSPPLSSFLSKSSPERPTAMMVFNGLQNKLRGPFDLNFAVTIIDQNL